MIEKVTASGKSHTELVQEGEGMFMINITPVGGAGYVAESDASVKEDAKEAAKVVEINLEEDVDMGGLFGGDDDY